MTCVLWVDRVQIQASPEKLLSVIRDVAGSQLLEDAQRQAQSQLSAGSVALEDVSKQIQVIHCALIHLLLLL